MLLRFEVHVVIICNNVSLSHLFKARSIIVEGQTLYLIVYSIFLATTTLFGYIYMNLSFILSEKEKVEHHIK